MSSCSVLKYTCINYSLFKSLVLIIKISCGTLSKGYLFVVPGTKLAQAAKFNDPNHPCKVLVATDAVGMGLNL